MSKPKSKVSSQRPTHAKSAPRVKIARAARVGRSASEAFERVAYHAYLSLECYAYTDDVYWLECAFADCCKARLDWDTLCLAALGRTVPPPRRK